jgi:hypothetical protein
MNLSALFIRRPVTTTPHHAGAPRVWRDVVGRHRSSRREVGHDDTNIPLQLDLSRNIDAATQELPAMRTSGGPT